MLSSVFSRVTVGVCAYNEEKNIEKLLRNLIAHQGLDQNSEIIVVCSGCTDHTPELVEEFVQSDKRVHLIIERERRGKASAINAILETFKGDFLFLIPADVIPAPHSLPRLLEDMTSKPHVGVMCGKPVPINEDKGFSGYLAHLMWRLHHRTLKYIDSLQLSIHASGELMVMRRGVVESIPVDIVNDDAYIAAKAVEKNLAVQYCQDAVVYIRAPTNIQDFVEQRRRVVYGHHHTKQVTKRSPRNLESMILYDPSKTVHVLKEEVRERPKDAPKLLAAIFIEVAVNFLALTDVISKRSHTVWKVAESTKELS